MAQLGATIRHWMFSDREAGAAVILEIARQRPDATRVAGFWKWKELGRSVKKGEKGTQNPKPGIAGVKFVDRHLPSPSALHFELQSS